MVALSEPLFASLSPFAEMAEALYEAGYSPIPIMPREKMPGTFEGGRWSLMQGWNSHSATRADTATLAKWKTWPNAGVGIALGTPVAGFQLIAIDFDTDDHDELELLQSMLPLSPMRKRGQRGYTAFYRASMDVKTKRYMVPAPTSLSPNKKRTLLEVLTGNAPRQTVMPPSIHPDTGREYEWATDIGIEPIARLPILTADHFEQLEDTLEHLGWNGQEEQRAEPAALGDDDPNIFRETNEAALRNLDAWVQHLGLPKLRRHGNGSWEGVPFFRDSGTGQPLERRKANLKFHAAGIKDMGTDQGYTALDVLQTVFAWDLDESFVWLRQKLGLDDFSDMNVTAPPRLLIQHDDGSLSDNETGEIVAPVPANDNADELPDHLVRPPGLLGDVADWIYSSARSPSWTLAIATALVVIGTLAGRRDAGPTWSGTALYVLCVMPSGTGKQHGIDCLKRLLRSADAGELIGAGEFMSSTSIIAHLTHQPLSACPMDEFGSFLKRIGSRRAASHEMGITRLLRQAFGVPFSSMETPAWANVRSRSLYSPALSILGMSTPQQFYGALSGADVEDGTLNRFLVLRSNAKPVRREPLADPFTVPADIETRLRQLYLARGRSDLATTAIEPGYQPIEPQYIGWGRDAQQVFDAFDQKMERYCDDHPEVRDYYARAVELSVRLATIVAVGRDEADAKVSKEDMEWGRDVALWANRRLATDASRYSSETEAGGRWTKVLTKLEQTKDGRMLYADLNGSLRFSQRDMDETLKSMAASGLIADDKVARSDGKKGRPARVIRLL